MSTSVVTVINNSSFEITKLVLREREQSYFLPPVGSGQKIIWNYHFKFEGSIFYSLSLNGSTNEGVIFGYVTGGMGKNATIMIKKDGLIEIER